MLNHACKVVRPGQSFLCGLIDLLHHIHKERGRNVECEVVPVTVRRSADWFQENEKYAKNRNRKAKTPCYEFGCLQLELGG